MCATSLVVHRELGSAMTVAKDEMGLAEFSASSHDRSSE